MSYPTQEQPNEGAPQPSGAPESQPYAAAPAQPYGADPNQPYGGVPAQPYGGVPGQPYAGPYGAPPVPQTNGLATAGLIFGILPFTIIGLVLSILGLNRASKIGGVGKGRALTGLIFSIVWIIAIVAVVAFGSSSGGSKVVKRLNPGCVAAVNFSSQFESKFTADASDPDALKTDLQQTVTELNKDAGKSTNAAAGTAMRNEASDMQKLLDDLNSGTVPDSTLVANLSSDDAAINTACGR